MTLRPPTIRDAQRFLVAAASSRRLHGTWVTAPSDRAGFRSYVGRFGGAGRTAQHRGFVVVRNEDQALVGVVNLSEIVRGFFQSAYLGYYVFAPYAGKGYMTEALLLVLDKAFGDIALHRVEVNVQPDNARSLALVERVGFTREGYSKRYVKVAGRWRDHVRFAMTVEDWPATRRALKSMLKTN
ncbi:MAG TPA: GNAT family protein [Casimicrobiaceae bacterium]|nr:GNAT family protein [Casimicrobiaceae bacterium]